MALHEVTFPDKYDLAASYADIKLGNIEDNSNIPDVKKLALYALRSFVDNGPCTSPAPSMWYMKERYKHQAYKTVSDEMSKFEAMVKYVEQVEEFLPTGKDWVEDALREHHSNNDGSGGDQQVVSSSPARDVNDTSRSTPVVAHSPSAVVPNQPLTTSSSNNTTTTTKPVFDLEAQLNAADLDQPALDPASEISLLRSEVARLRRILGESGIDHRTGAKFQHKNQQESPERQSNTTTMNSGGDLPSSSASIGLVVGQTLSSSHTCDGPATPLTPDHGSSITPTEMGKHPVVPQQPIVYYGQQPPQRIGWLEWLGLSGGSSKQKEFSTTPQTPSTGVHGSPPAPPAVLQPSTPVTAGPVPPLIRSAAGSSLPLPPLPAEKTTRSVSI